VTTRRIASARKKTTAVIFPFDLFGSGGTGAGADLVGDELDEILADNRRETVPTRAKSYGEHVNIHRFTFETQEAYRTWRADGRRVVRQALKRGDFLLWISGNHAGTLPIYDELAGSGDDTLVVQFDAHLDIHHFADCTKELSHGNFLLHCDGPLPKVTNLGHRELLLTPEYVSAYFHRAVGVAELALDELPARQLLSRSSAAARRIFIDIDCDVLDPAFFPAVSQAVPFGLSPQTLLRLVDATWSPQVAGVLLSEFDPGRDRADQSLATLVWLIEYLLLRRYE
jgi:arginase family enzyme